MSGDVHQPVDMVAYINFLLLNKEHNYLIIQIRVTCYSISII